MISKVHYQIPIVIVGFRNADDIIECLSNLNILEEFPSYQVFIAENGGNLAFVDLLETLENSSILERVSTEGMLVYPENAIRVEALRMKRQGSLVQMAEMSENLGYAGAVNSWLRPLLEVGGWQGVWILNPDTAPAPNALNALVTYAAERSKGLVGSRLVLTTDPDHLQSRGLAWVKLKGAATAVDRRAPSSVAPDPSDIERRLDAPSGASVYATRELIEAIGLMDERYFLYFEDLEWGCRAKAINAVGYAHGSIVVHKGGSTIGTAPRKADRSPLSVYLEFRNRILFTRERYPGWLPWTVFMQLVHAARLPLAGASHNLPYALRGLAAGLAGKTGRPTGLTGAVRTRKEAQA